jgi:hypothetical protein
LNNSASFTGIRHAGHFAQSSPARVGGGRFPFFRGGGAAPAGFCSRSDMSGIYSAARPCITPDGRFSQSR